MFRRYISVVVSVVMLLLSLLYINVYASPAIEDVTVDFGSVIAPVTYIGSGFLQVDYKNLKDDKLVTDLKPQRVRQGWAGEGAFNQYDKIASLGIPSQIIVLSDHRVKDLSWADSAAYNTKKALDEGKKFIYDIFNEPDHNTQFFEGTDYYTQWDLCYNAIRAVDSNAVISGPGYMNYNKSQIQDFLNHCKSSNTVPNIVTWHFGTMSKMSDYLKEIKDYANSIGIGSLISEYAIDENIWSDIWYNESAGYIVQLFANAERARIHTIHSSWYGDGGPNLGGILRLPSQSKTSQWWAYKTYADMSGDIVKTTQSNNYDAVASRDPNLQKAIVLLGSKGDVGGKSANVVMNNIPSYMVNNGYVHVKIESILYSDAECKGLTLVSEADYPVSKNSVSITKSVAARDALVLTVTKGTTKRSTPTPIPTPKPIAGKAFIESDGMVVMEAENYTSTTSRSSHKWEANKTYKGYSGTGSMYAGPDNGKSTKTNIETTSPEMVYKVNFSTTGTYYAWARLYSKDKQSDSIHLGLDGVFKGTWRPASLNSYIWENNVADVRLTLKVTKAGIHYINVYMGEDGCRIDKIILTKDQKYKPSGTGPAKSPK
jgi:Gylcosyl hydrolase family 115 C-terminal domain/Glycosyl hydrolases family 39